MRHLLTLILFACFFSMLVSCEDTLTIDTTEGAIDKCTIIGRVLNYKGEPYKNVPIKLYYEYTHWQSLARPTDYRLKDSAMTDEDGIYRLNLLRKEDETKLEKEDDYNLYSVFIDVDMPEYGLNTGHCIKNLDEFWKTKDTVMPDFYLLDTHYIDVSLSRIRPDATECSIVCVSKNPVTGFDELLYYFSISTAPYSAKWKVPVCSNIKVIRSWDNLISDTLKFEPFQLPDAIDMYDLRYSMAHPM